MILYLVDDEFDRHMSFQALARRLDVDMPGRFSCPQLRGIDIPVTRESAEVLARRSLSIEFLWGLYNSTESQVVVLLDLVISDSIATESDQRSAVNECIARLEQSNPKAGESLRSALTIVDTEPIFERHFSAAFVATIATLKGWKVVIASRNANRPAVLPFKRRLNCISVPEEDLSNYVESLSSSLDHYNLDATEKREALAYLTECYVSLLRMMPHTDPLISRCLMVYSEPFTSKNFIPWWHDACKGPTALATVGKLFDSPCAVDSGLVKALFMHSEFDGGFDFSRQMKQLTRDQLLAICGTLGLAAECASTSFLLPCNPGMAFLVALKELQNELNQQYPLPEKSFTFGSTKGQDGQSKEYSVTIKLSPNGNSHELNHFCEFMRRIGAGAELPNPPNGGVSLALWNACHARLGSLYDHANTQCFRLFREGTKGFIAWPCFAENLITLRWCQHLHLQSKAS